MCLAVSQHGANSGKFSGGMETTIGVVIAMKDGDADNFEKLKSQFLPSLRDNLRQCFPTSEFLEEISCLSKSCWPFNRQERAIFG